MGSWQIRPSTFFLIAFAMEMVSFAIPGGTEYILPFVSIPIFIYLRKLKHIQKADVWDYVLIPAYTFIGIVGLLYLQLVTLVSVPWWQIILVGILADVVASLLGGVPVVGDAISAFVNLIIALLVIGGVEGGIIGLILAIISMIPGPSLGANTFMLIIFKALSKLTLSGI